jgi:hypothetical protein
MSTAKGKAVRGDANKTVAQLESAWKFALKVEKKR